MGEPKAVLVLTTYGEFRVATHDEWGNPTIVASGYDLAEVLRDAAARAGYPIGIALERAA